MPRYRLVARGWLIAVSQGKFCWSSASFQAQEGAAPQELLRDLFVACQPVPWKTRG